MSEPPKRIILEGAEGQLFLSRLITKALMARIIVFIIGIVSFVTGRDGAAALVVGSILSAMALWRFTLQVGREAATGRIERSWDAALTGYAAFVPYLFGCYLVFYRGFWGLTDLVAAGFSWPVLARTAFFVLFGFAVVNGTYKISEVAKAVTDGHVRIK